MSLYWAKQYPPVGSDGVGRVGHTVAFIQGLAVPVGGYTPKSTTRGSHDELLGVPSVAFHLSELDWRPVPHLLPKSVLPRVAGASAVSTALESIVYGGEQVDTRRVASDAVVVGMRNGALTVSTADVTGDAPPARRWHASCAVPASAVAMGMAAAREAADDAEAEGDGAGDGDGDGGSGSGEPSPPGTPSRAGSPSRDPSTPLPRLGSPPPVSSPGVPAGTSVSMFVHGGEDGAGGRMDDAWCFNPQTRTWTTGDAPAPRMHHTATYCHSLAAVVVFGGFDGSSLLNDVHMLELRSMTWRIVECSGDVPSGRSQHAATWARVPVYGSTARSATDLTSVSPRLVVHGGRTEHGLADDTVFELDLATGVWHRLLTSRPLPARFGHVLVTSNTTVGCPEVVKPPYLPSGSSSSPTRGECGGGAVDTDSKLDALDGQDDAADGEDGDQKDAADDADADGGDDAGGDSAAAGGDAETGGGAPADGGDGADGAAAGAGSNADAAGAADGLPATDAADVLVCLGGGNGKGGVESAVFTLVLDPFAAYRGREPKDADLGWTGFTDANGDHYEGSFENHDRNGDGKCTYANGDVYEGQWVDGKRHGDGKCINADGGVYDGQWVHDVRQGTGVMTYGADTAEDTYTGPWQGDARHGVGTCTYKNGDKYEGSWLADQRHGDGTLTYGDGGVYEGQWEDDLRHGTGYFRNGIGDEYTGSWLHGNQSGTGSCMYANGSVYRGTWLKGVRNGVGQFRATNQDLYDGKWNGGVRCGHGVCTYAGGTTYDGTWKADKREGTGVLSCADGSKYEGGWLAGQRDGHGRSQDADGTVYDGDWQADHRHGYGECTYHDGHECRVYTGQWVRGQRQGRGTCTYADGRSYEGEWGDDAPHGRGVMTYPNGDTYDGEWRHGLREPTGVLRRAEPTPACGDQAGMEWYDGLWTAGEQSGIGKAQYTNGDLYDGEWLLGKRHGHGVAETPAGEKYEGAWVNDAREGYGVLSDATGVVYKGGWLKGVRQGFGVGAYGDGGGASGAHAEDSKEADDAHDEQPSSNEQ